MANKDFDWYWERKRSKYASKIKAERANFLFLTDGSMVYNYEKFDDHIDALIDAVKNHGEDLDDMISLIYLEEIDQRLVKPKILKLMNEK